VASRAFAWAVLAVPALIATVAGWLHRWTFDDGFIYFRVVDQIRAGNGPVFNVGERVEVATGTAWLAILTIADIVSPLRLEWTAVILGITATAAGVAFATAGAYQIARVGNPAARWIVPFGSMVFVSVTAIWFWTTAGVETGLTIAWLGASWWILARWSLAATGSVTTLAAVVLGAGWLIRPDMVLFSVAFFVLLVGFGWAKGARRDAVRIAGAMLALPVAYQVFRMGY
jgi:arabinofuranosyltransferase